MSKLSSVCDDILELQDASNVQNIGAIASRCASLLEHTHVIIDTIDAGFVANVHTASRASRLLALWFLVDKLCKTHELFISGFQERLAGWAAKGTSARHEPGWWEAFLLVLDSLKNFFPSNVVALVKLKADPSSLIRNSASQASDHALQPSERPSRALVQHSTQLLSLGGFTSNSGNNQRTGEKGALQVRTVDSLMAMSVASAYAPARPVEIQLTIAPKDVDAPAGYVQALPENYQADYETQRRKRLREVMETNRREDDRRSRERLVGGSSLSSAQAELTSIVTDNSDITMPEELPRDEYGVKRGNYPEGVRFIRDAIRDCGGVIELDVIVQRISTLANKEVASEFGDVREFLVIHQPTFRLHLENEGWVVQLAPSAFPPSTHSRVPPGTSPSTYADRHRQTEDSGSNDMGVSSIDLLPTDAKLATQCPYCTQYMKSRNLARHVHCRRCIATQIALALSPNPVVRGPISEMTFAAKWIIEHRQAFDDHDVLWFARCINAAAAIPRYRLSSSHKFLPILKAIRVVRDEWLRRKGLEPYLVTSIGEVPLDSGDLMVVELFKTVGANIYRLPVAWIETGDLIDLCKRFSSGVKPAHTPPPRPADPRISMQNDFPGLLFCESEIDSEDDASDDEAAYSDDEGEGFQFAPPVTTVDTLITAGFARDTKRLNHKLRTAPPLVHSRVLRGDGSMTHAQTYSAASAEAAAAQRQQATQQQQFTRGQQGGVAPVVSIPSSIAADETKRVYF